MFSSDNNVETIAQLVEELKKYGSLRLELFRLDATEKVVKIITSLILVVALSVLVFAFLTYLSFAAAYGLGEMLGSFPKGFLAVAGFYLFLLVVIYIRRKAWIERPIVHLLAEILLEKEQ